MLLFNGGSWRESYRETKDKGVCCIEKSGLWIVEQDKESGFDIKVKVIESQLPEGCEHMDAIASDDMLEEFFNAIDTLQQPFKQLLEEYRPNCIVLDANFQFTMDADELNFPTILFNGFGFFASIIIFNARKYINIALDDTDTILVPDLPDKIEMRRFQLTPAYSIEKEIKSKPSYLGILVNSFCELEPAYAEIYKKTAESKVWQIGPVSVCNKNIIDKTLKGTKSTLDEHYCMKWLDSKEPNSVIYVSFGSMSRFSSSQLFEIATGFEERIAGKGLVIRDWAPQVLILDHPAIGGFVTHCGWNSILEAVTAGVPMITWPLFAEQFYNEKLVTQVLKIGIQAGIEVWSEWLNPVDTSVNSETVTKLVTQLMGSGEKSLEMRSRARKLSEMANEVVVEGGSSYAGLTSLIEDIRAYKQPLPYKTKLEQRNTAYTPYRPLIYGSLLLQKFFYILHQFSRFFLPF
ncbi:hypothetical protein GIB67_016337 [Kingdonia uniflora]|uniref:Glycosyltransferase n=1 Tax=Kingdonia uniflora TaxID=39325 RepID=A0A7J7M9G9_9MAGN|nr:hypothetical protein GIB67_016337 [Kingdonia uniflora]